MATKTQSEIESKLCSIDEFGSTQYPAATYEQGAAEALRWVMGEVSDDEFTFDSEDD